MTPGGNPSSLEGVPLIVKVWIQMVFIKHHDAAGISVHESAE